MNEFVARGADDFAAQRRMMVDRQIRTFEVTDQGVLAAVLATPREIFLPRALAPLAYSDACLEVGDGGAGETRRLLSPMTLARMIQDLGVGPQDACLDLAGGGGYGAALLARLAESAIALESVESFTARAEAGFGKLGLAKARAVTGRLWDGAGAGGPFDAILLNGATEVAPEGLFPLLAERGRLAAISKDRRDPTGAAAVATLWTKTDGQIGRRPLFNAVAPVLPGFAAPAAFSF